MADRNLELEREYAQLGADFAALKADHAALKQQLEWFKRQLFGRKSEKRLEVDPAVQGSLLSALGVTTPPPPKDEPKETITYQRRQKCRDGAVNDTGLRFGEDVPREIIAVNDPDIVATDGPFGASELVVSDPMVAYILPRQGGYGLRPGLERLQRKQTLDRGADRFAGRGDGAARCVGQRHRAR